jgi:PilZ domain
MLSARISERRSAPRHRVLKRGMIQFRHLTVECVVRNLSPGGACLMVETLTPDQFRLFWSDDLLGRSCRVVWRSGNRLGVSFETAPVGAVTPNTAR